MRRSHMSPREAAATRRRHAPLMVGDHSSTAHLVCEWCTGAMGREVGHPCRYRVDAEVVRPVDRPPRWRGVLLVLVFTVWSILTLLLSLAAPWPAGAIMLAVSVGAPLCGLVAAARRQQ
jgi:hypothetical protein